MTDPRTTTAPSVEAAGPTPSQTVGPFFHGGLVPDGGHHVVPAGHPAALLLSGRVLDGAGDPVTDAMVEVWQLDPEGRTAPGSSLAGFTGAGRVAADATGTYRVRVVAPPATTTVDGVPQAPHLDLVVHARGVMRHLVTRAYVLPGDPAADRDAVAGDPVLSRLEPSLRDRLLARPDEHGLRFDIVLQGPDETPFFDV